jgi:Transposase DDE domain
MPSDHTCSPESTQPHEEVAFYEQILLPALPNACGPAPKNPKRPGRPASLTWSHLWFGLILAILQRIASYSGLHRLLAEGPLGPFQAVCLTDDAIVKRLKQAGTSPLQQVLHDVSCRLAELIHPHFPADLAPFARDIFALDESTWDAVERHLPSLRAVPKGDPQLLAGKIAGRFNVRTQQWDLVQLRENPVGNCKLDLSSLLVGLLPACLLLFDLGYFSFAFYDSLCHLQIWFITRLRERVSYQIAHTFFEQGETLDALVWLGSQGRNSVQSGHLLRLVRFRQQGQLRSYLTNQLDPLLLPPIDVARLYARRWDIELAFLTLKEHLGLHHWWSGHLLLRQQQTLLVLIAAQLLQAQRMLIAWQKGCDPFEVSLPLLVFYTPKLLHQNLHPVDWVLLHGADLDFFRPSSRLQVQAPDIPAHALCWPPADLFCTRPAVYLTYPPRPHRAARRRAAQAGELTSAAHAPPVSN